MGINIQKKAKNYPADFLSQLLFLHFSPGPGLKVRSNRGSEGAGGRRGSRASVGVVVDFTSFEAGVRGKLFFFLLRR